MMIEGVFSLYFLLAKLRMLCKEIFTVRGKVKDNHLICGNRILNLSKPYSNTTQGYFNIKKSNFRAYEILSHCLE